jgi:hypothetical protein
MRVSLVPAFEFGTGGLHEEPVRGAAWVAFA